MLKLGRYDYLAYATFMAYACCAFALPLMLVDVAEELHFPLNDGGMGTGGMLEVSRSLPMFVTLLFCGMIARRIGKRRSMGWCMLFSGAGLLACTLVSHWSWLIPCMLIAGVGEGLCEGLATPFVNDLHKDNPSQYVTISHAFWSAGTLLIVLVTGGISFLHLNWRWLMCGTGLFSLAISAAFFWKESPGKSYPEANTAAVPGSLWQKSRRIFVTPRFWCYCLCMGIGAGAEYGLTFWSASFVRLTFQAGAWFGALGMASIAMGMLLGRMSFGRFVPSSRIWHALMASALCGIPLSLGLAFLRPGLFGGVGWKIYLLLYALLFLCGICIAPFWPFLQVYGVLRMPQHDSTLLYVYFSAAGVPCCGFFTWLIGWFGDRWGLTAGLLTVPVFMLLYGLVLLVDRRMRWREATAANAGGKDSL